MDGARPARTTDLARCAELLAAARAGATTRRGGALLLAEAGWAEEGDDLALVGRWSERADQVLLAGVFDDAVVGLGAGRVRQSGHGGPRTGVIDCCYVEPAARQVGVGGALVAELVAWFTERGCTGVDAPALPGDGSTKRLFEAAGLSARLLVLHRPLP